jgi:hypothetical protein
MDVSILRGSFYIVGTWLYCGDVSILWGVTILKGCYFN